MTHTLRIVTPNELLATRHYPVDQTTLRQVAKIFEDIEARGEQAVRKWAERYGDIQPCEPLVLQRAAFEDVPDQIDQQHRELLERAAGRIRSFATAQRRAMQDGQNAVPGGIAGFRFAPVENAGCYAPAGRYPLPSSMLMTAITARVAGVRHVSVATPRVTPIMLAAAAISGADTVLAVGGAQAIAALSCGIDGIPPCDAIVGPGNRWVTAAKKHIAGHVSIDMLAGPSELLVIADETASPKMIAADLLAQAEHDDDALPILICTDRAVLDAVQLELTEQLHNLSTAHTARTALANGFAVLAESIEHAAHMSDSIAPEHVQLLVHHASQLAKKLQHYGTVFIGKHAAEVFGDYGIGPNHTLPTGGAARCSGGLSVMNFLRMQTWLQLDEPIESLIYDTAAFARLEGLEAHARAAEARLESVLPTVG